MVILSLLFKGQINLVPNILCTIKHYKIFISTPENIQQFRLLRHKMSFCYTLKFYLYHYQQLRKDFSLPAHQKSKQTTNQKKIPPQSYKNRGRIIHFLQHFLVRGENWGCKKFCVLTKMINGSWSLRDGAAQREGPRLRVTVTLIHQLPDLHFPFFRTNKNYLIWPSLLRAEWNSSFKSFPWCDCDAKLENPIFGAPSEKGNLFLEYFMLLIN